MLWETNFVTLATFQENTFETNHPQDLVNITLARAFRITTIENEMKKIERKYTSDPTNLSTLIDKKNAKFNTGYASLGLDLSC